TERPRVELILNGSGEHLHTDDHVSPAGDERIDDRSLHGVVVGVVVALAEVDVLDVIVGGGNGSDVDNLARLGVHKLFVLGGYGAGSTQLQEIGIDVDRKRDQGT